MPVDEHAYLIRGRTVGLVHHETVTDETVMQYRQPFVPS